MFRRKLRVRVVGHNGVAGVVLHRWGSGKHEDIVVGQVNLTCDDSDEQLSTVKMKAKDMAKELNGLET